MNAPFATDPDQLAVLDAMRQQEAAGHTADTDMEMTIGQLGTRAHEMSIAANDAAHASAEPNLDLVYRRAARTAAMNLALMRRLRRDARWSGQ